MNLKHVLAAGALLLSVAAIAAPAAASTSLLTVGDTLDLQYNFPGLGDNYSDSGDFTYTGAGQTLLTQGGITSTILYDDHVIFSESPGCGSGCTQTTAAFNGPVLFDLTNGAAFSGWQVLSDTVGITSSVIQPGEVGVNWQGAPVQGQVVVGVSGVPEPATWAMMLVGVAGLGGALRLSGRKSAAPVAA